jgi:hypothetical protein
MNAPDSVATYRNHPKRVVPGPVLLSDEAEFP